MKTPLKLKIQTSLFTLSLLALVGASVVAPSIAFSEEPRKDAPDTNVIEELDPFAPDIEDRLLEIDRLYRQRTEKSPYLEGFETSEQTATSGCFRSQCAVYAWVRKSDQKLYLYLNGNPHAEWLVSTGAPGRETPNFDRHPNGRIYDQYTSRTFPGGNYKGLGNMPYAVFISGGFAIHGTTERNFKHLGKKASHGCVRLHPDNALIFNRLVREHGIANVWIQVD